MSNYNILQLNAKELSELKDIAAALGLKVSNSAKKETLVYDILDQQHNDGITFDDGFFEDVEGVQAFLNVRRGAISFAVVLQHCAR